MAAVDVDQQVQVAAGGDLAAGHRAEDPDIAHAEPLAETEDHIAVSPYLVQGDGAPRSLSAQYRLPSRARQRAEHQTLMTSTPGMAS